MRKDLPVVALLLAGAAGGAQGSLRYATEMEEWRETAHRLELRTPVWRLLAVERGVGLDPEYLAFGLACPWGALGPLAPRGLLRGLADPLGYSPASEVFEEEAGFRLDGSLEGASRRGLWLEPFPGGLGLFALGVPDGSGGGPEAGLWGPLELVQAGAAGRIRWPSSRRPAGRASPPGFAEAEVLALLSIPGFASSASGEQEWLEDLPSFPGGKLAHLAGRLRLEGAEDAGRLSCCLMGAASGGQRVPPGLFGLCALEVAGGAKPDGEARPKGRLEGGAWNAQGLLGACSPEYRTPEGESYAGIWTAGLRLEIRPCPTWRLAGSWRRRVDRPPADRAPKLPGSEEGELIVRLQVPLAAGGRLEVQADALARARYADDGGVEPSVKGGLEAGLGGKQGGLGLELRGTWQEGVGELRGLFRGQRGGTRLQAGAVIKLPEIEEAFGLFPFGRLELTGQTFLFWLSAEEGKDGVSLSLGWSVTQALPASPTSRTSRSRR